MAVLIIITKGAEEEACAEEVRSDSILNLLTEVGEVVLDLHNRNQVSVRIEADVVEVVLAVVEVDFGRRTNASSLQHLRRVSSPSGRFR